jgi:NAD(P)-dependent dehydrogenase (short-subunit alcohol dehydrogenase family)
MRTKSAAQPSCLLGQTVVVIGGSSGIGLATARRAKAEGAQLIITGRRAGTLEEAADEIGVEATAAFDAQDLDQLEAFLVGLPTPVDHVMLSAGGPYYARLDEIDFAQARRAVERLLIPLCIARFAAQEMRAGGSLVFISGTGARRPNLGLAVPAILTAAMPALVANLALETAPVRVNLIAAGFVDTPLSAKLLGDRLEQRREQLRAALPIRQVVGPEDVAALAIHLMTNTALTGATYDIDGGQQLVDV